jgi:bacteriorhodopsin
MGNGALQTNGFTNTVTVNNHITVRGSDWYWTVCAVMIASTGVIMGLSFTKPRSGRLFHYITGAITMISAVAYFSMASNLGWTGIQVEFERSDSKVHGNIRQIFYVRYIDWVLTTPLLLLDLLLTCGLPTPTICYTILINEIMVVTGLIGALVKSSYKWGFFTFGCVAFLFVAWTVVFEGRSYARVLGADILKTYTICGVWTVFIWFLYPISWGVSEGGNVIAPDSEAIFYGILDLMSKPVFGALLLWGHRNIDISRLGINIRDPIAVTGTSSEKPVGAGTTGVTNGTNDAPPA